MLGACGWPHPLHQTHELPSQFCQQTGSGQIGMEQFIIISLHPAGSPNLFTVAIMDDSRANFSFIHHPTTFMNTPQCKPLQIIT